MDFQQDPDVIRWKIHLKSSPPAVYRMLATDQGRAASTTQLEELRQAVRPLARKLAARVAAKRRRRHRGRLDVRRTLRRSLQYGGVPVEPAFRARHATRPDLFVLADVSGSVVEFAEFTLSLLYAMSRELGRLRSFAFVDGIDELT